MYRHLINKENDFIVGIMVPDSAKRLIYAGKAKFKYSGTINYKNILCRYYEIYMENFSSTKGYLYTDLSNGALVEFDMPIKNNINYNSFKFSLIDSIKMSKEEWENFIMKMRFIKSISRKRFNLDFKNI